MATVPNDPGGGAAALAEYAIARPESCSVLIISPLTTSGYQPMGWA